MDMWYIMVIWSLAQYCPFLIHLTAECVYLNVSCILSQCLPVLSLHALFSYRQVLSPHLSYAFLRNSSYILSHFPFPHVQPLIEPAADVRLKVVYPILPPRAYWGNPIAQGGWPSQSGAGGCYSRNSKGKVHKLMWPSIHHEGSVFIRNM